ncbi:MAG: LptF/LptG family permease [Bacteroidales bacterium]|nr:LptF/LptG family permease [Bacteroidales bacterium]
MKRVHLLILRSFIGPFFLIFFIVLFVLLMQFLWRYIDELVGKGLDFKVIVQFLLYTSATLVPMALPLSILMSSLMTFGNLGEKYELTAMKASGISLQRIMSPLIILVVLVSFGAFFFANRVLPYANLQMRSLLYDIRAQRPELQLKPGEFVNMMDAYSIRISSKNPKTNTLYNVQIYDHSAGKGNTSIILADSGYMRMTADDKQMIITLFNGYSYNELEDSKSLKSYPHRYDKFDEQQIIIELSGFSLQRTDQSLFKSHYAMMDLQQLEQMEDSLMGSINERQEQIYKNIAIGNLFKKRDIRTPEGRAGSGQPPAASNLHAENGTHESRGNFLKPKKKKLRAHENNKTTKPDSLHKTSSEKQVPAPPLTAKQTPTINIDSVFNLLSYRDKSRVASSALTYARNAKNIVENSVQTLEYNVSYLRRFQIEWHRKFTIAFACLIFLFIGAPLGAIIRKGGLGLPLVLSVIFFIFYYILTLTGEKLVRESIVPAYHGMWYTSALFFVSGIFLTYKAATDSTILNIDTYLNFLKKIFGQRYNVVDKLSIQTENIQENKAKPDNIYNSLLNLEESIDEQIEAVNTNLQLTEFLGTLFALQADSNLILFERYYNNTFRIIINHRLFHKKNIRAKIFEFPAFNYKDFQDENGRLVIRVILACTVLLTPIVAARHLMQMLVLRAKLKRIKQLLPELQVMIKIHESEFKTYENPSGL